VTSMDGTHNFLLFALAALALGIGSEALAQNAEHQPVSSNGLGPTLDARAVTAQGLTMESAPELEILIRHAAFERELAAAFGFPVASGSGVNSGFVHDVRLWMTEQWSDSRFDNWAQSALLTYARLQSSTRFERNGFHMGVDVDNVAQGKFGIRVSRPLE
jgi:hypothetical protein